MALDSKLLERALPVLILNVQRSNITGVMASRKMQERGGERRLIRVRNICYVG